MEGVIHPEVVVGIVNEYNYFLSNNVYPYESNDLVTSLTVCLNALNQPNSLK